MTIEKLRSIHRTDPFQPFVLKLRDGREYAVHRREYIAMSPIGGVIVVSQPDDSVIYTDLDAIRDIESLSESAQSAV